MTGPQDIRYEHRRCLHRNGPRRVDLVFDRVAARDVAAKGTFGRPGSPELRAVINEFRLCRLLRGCRIPTALDLLVVDADRAPSWAGAPPPDQGRDGRFAWFTMEFLEGPPLLAPGEDLGREEALRRFASLVDAVSGLHHRGLVVRDLKPENAIVVASRGVFLIDLALADTERPLGYGGYVEGTEPYLAPESIRGEAPSRASDLYSLGVILHRLLGRDFPDRRSPGSVPGPEGALLRRLLADAPHDRPPSIDAVAAEVASLLGDPGPPPHPAATPPVEWIDGDGLRQAVRAAGIGDPDVPAALLVGGPAGAGKSRLLDEMAAWLPEEGVRTLGVRHEGWGVARLFGDVAGLLRHGAQSGAFPAAREALGRLQAAALPNPGEPGAAERRRAVLRAVGHAVEVLDLAPACLLVDRPEDLDTEAFGLLAEFLASPSLAGVSAIVASRGEALAPLDRAAPSAARLDLEPLSERALLRFSERAARGRHFPPAWCRSVLRRTDGRPGRVLALLAGAGAGPPGDPTPPPEGASDAAAPHPPALPPDLPPSLAQTLRELAVVGRVARGAAPRVLGRRALADLDRLEVLGLVQLDRGRGDDSARVADPDLAAALASGVPEARREALHAAAAEAKSGDATVLGSAVHLEWLEHLLGAGASALAAAELARLGRMPDPPGPPDGFLALARRCAAAPGIDEADRAACQELAGTCVLRLGETATGRDLLEGAWRSARMLPRGEARSDAMARIGLRLVEADLAALDLDSALARTAEMLAEPGLGVHHLTPVRLRRSQALCRAGRIQEGLAEADQALAEAAAGGDESILGRLVLARGNGRMLAGDGEGARKDYRDAAERAERLGDRRLSFSALHNLALLARRSGEVGEAVSMFQAALREAEASYDQVGLATASLNLGLTLLHADHAGECLQPLERARALFLQLGNLIEARKAAASVVDALVRCGQLERAQSIALEALGEADPSPGPLGTSVRARLLVLLGEAQARQGRVEGAATRWREAIGLYRELGLAADVAEVEAKLAEAEGPRGDPAADGMDEVARHLDVASGLLRREEERLEGAGDSVGAEMLRRRRSWVEAATAGHGPPWAGGDQDASRLAVIDSVLERAQGLQDWGRLTRSLLGEAIRLLEADRGFLIEVDGGGRVAPGTRRCLYQIRPHEAREVCHSLVAECLRTGRPIIAEDACSNPDFSSFLTIRRERLRSVACWPLAARGRVLGVLYLDHHERPGLFTGRRTETLRRMSRLATALLDELRGTEHRLRSRYHFAAWRGDYGFVGASPATFRVMEQVDDLVTRPTGRRVAIVGEAGTGKRLVASSLHRRCRIQAAGAPRGDLVEVDGSRLPHGGASSILARGVQQARGGTVVVSHVEKVPAEALRVLLAEAGGTTDVIGLSRRDLAAEAARGAFASDAYCELAETLIHIPPLRERPDDVPPLVERVLVQCGDVGEERRRLEPPAFTEEAVRWLMDHEWPGNVRELRLTVERVVARLRGGETVRILDLAGYDVDLQAAGGWQLKDRILEIEAEIIRQELARHAGRGAVEQVARSLGVTRQTVRNKLRQWEERRSSRRSEAVPDAGS